MVYRFQDRLDYLGERRKEVDSEEVTYARGVNSVTLSASLGHSEVNELIPGVAVTQTRRQDFFVDANELILAGNPTEPQVGDRITRQNGSIFRVVSEGEDSAPFDYTTPTEKRLRIHTEQVG